MSLNVAGKVLRNMAYLLPAPVANRAKELFAGEGLRTKAMRGSLWTMIGFGASQILRLCSNMLLTRILLPEAFGLMALVSVFMQGLEMFSDVGTGPSLIQNPRGDEPKFQDTAWTIQVIRGVILTLLACLLAYPAATFYDEPMLLQLLPIAGLTALISGLNPTKYFTVNRHLVLGKLTLIELATQIINLLLLVLLAILMQSVWAFVIGGLIGTAIKCYLMAVYLPGRLNHFDFDRASARELVTFGRWIFLATAISFMGQQFDRLYLGKVVSISELGIYSIGVAISMAAVSCNMQLIRRIGLPTLTHTYRDNRNQLTERYDRIRAINDCVFMPSLGALTLLAPTIVHVLYDQRYWGAGHVLQMLSIAAVVPCLLEPAEACVVAMGQPRWATLRYALRTVSCVVGIPLGWHYAQLDGVLLALVLCELPGLIALWTVLGRNKVLRFSREAKAFAMYFGASLVTWGALNVRTFLN